MDEVQTTGTTSTTSTNTSRTDVYHEDLGCRGQVQLMTSAQMELNQLRALVLQEQLKAPVPRSTLLIFWKWLQRVETADTNWATPADLRTLKMRDQELPGLSDDTQDSVRQISPEEMRAYELHEVARLKARYIAHRIYPEVLQRSLVLLAPDELDEMVCPYDLVLLGELRSKLADLIVREKDPSVPLNQKLWSWYSYRYQDDDVAKTMLGKTIIARVRLAQIQAETQWQGDED